MAEAVPTGTEELQLTDVTNQPAVEQIADESIPAKQESPAPSDDIDAFLKERGLLTEDETAEQAGEESQEDAWLSELNPEHKEKVEALLQQEKAAKENQRRAQAEGRRRTFQNFRAWTRQQLENAGVDTDTLTRIDNAIPQYHDHSLQFAQEEVAEAFAKGMYEYASKYLPTAEREAFKGKTHENNDAFFKELVEVSRKGYVSESASKKAAGEAVKGYQDWLLEKPERIAALSSRAKAPELNGSGAGYTGSMTLDQIDKMPNSQWLQIGSTDADGGHARRQKILDDARSRGR